MSTVRRDFALLLTLLCVSLAQLSIAQEPNTPVLKFERDGDWKPLFAGIDVQNMTVTAPRKMKAYAVRIRLDAPGIEFVATPDNGDREKETDGIYTSTFLKQQKCQLAINAGVFAPVTDSEGTGKDILGLHIANGKQVSLWEDGYQALAIEKGNDAKFLRRDAKDYSGIQTAVSGFKTVLWEGTIREGDETIHPRTLVGLSKDRKIMYWLVIDGRQSGYSEGAKKSEAAMLIKELGADSALNLDGGGTSTLVQEDAAGKPKVLNKPIHGGVISRERPSASHLGIRALPLQK